MSSEPKDTAIPAVQFVSSPDGDVILRSSDGVEFRADSAVLKRASPVFEDMAKLPPPKNEPLAPPVLVMEETSDVLDVLLCLLYPADAPQTITSNSQGRGLLRVVDKLQITSFVVLQALEAYIATVEPPLVAWAITTTSSVPSLRRAGVRRVFAADESSDLASDVPEELASVSARAVLTVLAAKKEALQKSRTMLSFPNFPWACRDSDWGDGHTNAATSWSNSHTQLMIQHPFDSIHNFEVVLEDIIRANSVKYLTLFREQTLVARRAEARLEIERLLD